MAANLIDLAKGLFSDNVIATASTSLNESEGGIKKAVEALVPGLLAGLFSKGQATNGAALPGLLDQVRELTGNSTNLSDVVARTISNVRNVQGDSWSGNGKALFHNLFEGQTGNVSRMVSDYAGIKESSAEVLLGAATPAVLGLVGNQAAAGQHPGGQGIWTYLLTQKDHILAALPAGFGLGSLLGFGSMASAAIPNNTSYSATAAYPGASRKKSSGGWLWLLLLVLIGLALWYFLGQKGCNKETTVPVTDTTKINMDTNVATTTTTTTTRESVKVQLPDGTELDAYKGGIEDLLVTFLKTDYKALGPDSLKNIWFDFDNLNFETGSAKITAESQAQVNNLTAILKAFPKAKLKIGGYTDKTGNEPANVKLSGERAAAVKEALKAAGVGAQVEGAEGYGSRFARFPAEAPEAERVKDRHVSVSVRG